jgi:hypothetical protein
LEAGSELRGPALCEEADTVIVVPEEWQMSIDEWGIAWLDKSKVEVTR